jgi:hypothetical protein
MVSSSVAMPCTALRLVQHKILGQPDNAVPSRLTDDSQQPPLTATTASMRMLQQEALQAPCVNTQWCRPWKQSAETIILDGVCQHWTLGPHHVALPQRTRTQKQSLAVVCCRIDCHSNTRVQPAVACCITRTCSMAPQPYI